MSVSPSGPQEGRRTRRTMGNSLANDKTGRMLICFLPTLELSTNAAAIYSFLFLFYFDYEYLMD